MLCGEEGGAGGGEGCARFYPTEDARMIPRVDDKFPASTAWKNITCILVELSESQATGTNPAQKHTSSPTFRSRQKAAVAWTRIVLLNRKSTQFFLSLRDCWSSWLRGELRVSGLYSRPTPTSISPGKGDSHVLHIEQGSRGHPKLPTCDQKSAHVGDLWRGGGENVRRGMRMEEQTMWR